MRVSHQRRRSFQILLDNFHTYILACLYSFVVGLLMEICPAGVKRVQEVVAGIVGRGRDEVEVEAEVPSEGEGPQAGPAPPQEHVMVHYFGSRALRR